MPTWYYVFKGDRLVATSSYPVSLPDLALRGEEVIACDEKIPHGEVERVGQEVRRHVRTAEEIEADAAANAKAERINKQERAIHAQLSLDAAEKLAADGIEVDPEILARHRKAIDEAKG